MHACVCFCVAECFLHCVFSLQGVFTLRFFVLQDVFTLCFCTLLRFAHRCLHVFCTLRYLRCGAFLHSVFALCYAASDMFVTFHVSKHTFALSRRRTFPEPKHYVLGATTCVCFLSHNLRLFSEPQLVRVSCAICCVCFLSHYLCVLVAPQLASVFWATTCVCLSSHNLRLFSEPQLVCVSWATTCVCFWATICVCLSSHNLRAVCLSHNVCVCLSSHNVCVCLSSHSVYVFVEPQRVCHPAKLQLIGYYYMCSHTRLLLVDGVHFNYMRY